MLCLRAQIAHRASFGTELELDLMRARTVTTGAFHYMYRNMQTRGQIDTAGGLAACTEFFMSSLPLSFTVSVQHDYWKAATAVGFGVTFGR
jgi:hypothetical protein